MFLGHSVVLICQIDITKYCDCIPWIFCFDLLKSIKTNQ